MVIGEIKTASSPPVRGDYRHFIKYNKGFQLFLLTSQELLLFIIRSHTSQSTTVPARDDPDLNTLGLEGPLGPESRPIDIPL